MSSSLCFTNASLWLFRFCQGIGHGLLQGHGLPRGPGGGEGRLVYNDTSTQTFIGLPYVRTP